MPTLADSRMDPRIAMGGFAAAVALAAVLCWAGVDRMVVTWFDREEYSHGVLIPFITLFLIWQKRFELASLTRHPSGWFGTVAVVLGVSLYFAGELSTLYILIQYAFLAIIYGLFMSLMGARATAIIIMPLLILSFMIPLPNFLYNNLSAKLQLLSSEIGVAVIRLFGISVYLEGNVIDLGTYKLQVVEACNGLRYLFPLMTLGFIVAYLYKAAFWKRAFIFLSTIPITVLMNSFRIGVIGVMVDRWGQSMAEGFLHDFEGWVIFMACFGVLYIEMWLLMRLTGDRRPLNAVFGLETPASSTDSRRSAMPMTRTLPASFVASIVAISLALVSARALPAREEIAPARKTFAEFPLKLGDWTGQTEVMEQIYVDALKFSDYALVNYRNGKGNYINFYAAYYDSQRKGQSVHSPRSCLPGGGWEIESLTQVNLPKARVDDLPLRVNRVEISHGDQKQLVYYWFQQRGRNITNEYLTKWFIFWDAITMNRTDGSLVRLTVPLPPGSDDSQLDIVLSDFAEAVSPILSDYIPN